MKYLTEITNIENELIEHNQISTEELFKLYASLHFIYPEKLQRLKPVFNMVRDNWSMAMQLNFPLFWVSTVKPNSSNILSTGTSWQFLNKGMIAQHLASNNPVGSRIIFLGMLNEVIQNQHKGFLESYQIFYRPQNSYPNKLFQSLSQRAGKALSQINSYDYIELPFLRKPLPEELGVFEIDNNHNPDFINFIRKYRGELYFKAQELGTDDITLKELNYKFGVKGLNRKRKIFVATDRKGHNISGVIIINQSSLGLNFSFFENSCELILSHDVSATALLDTASTLLHKASGIVNDLPLHYIPVLIDPIHSPIIEKLNGKVTRNYNLFMMLKGGYEIWYDQVDQLTNTVFQRFINNTYEKSFSF